MAKLLLLSSIALLFFLHLGTVKVANAGASNRIAPLQSTIYYLQDYCKLAEDGDFKDEEKENRRHRRSYNNDEFDFSDAIHQTIKDTKRRIKDQVKREQEIGRKWKQVFLDLATSPSVVVKLWRPDSIAEKDSLHQQLHRKLVESADIHQKVSCKLLLRLSKHLNESITAAAVNQKNNIVSSLANSTTLGAVVNFLKLNQKPSLTDYRLRIVSSDPNMTQYWISGRKLKPASNLEPQLPPQLPAAVDLVTNPAMHPKALMKEELELLNETIEEGGKWLLIELETINALILEDDNELEDDGKTPKTPPKQDNTELVISMFTRSARSADAASQLSGTTQSSSSGSNSKQTSQNNSTLQQKCPVGTFDCAGDGEQCIPSGLRCNGEDNCGNRLEELLNCGTVNLYYIFEDNGHHHNDFDFESDGFWFAVKILALLFLVCLLMYTASLLCRCCCDRGSRGGRQQQIITGRSPLVYHLRSGGAKGSSAGVSEPLISAAAGSRAMINSSNRPSSPPPGYYPGNQLDNQGSTINEHIYVNNHYNSNYGQPQGGTAVHTGVAVPIVSPQNGGRPNASAPAPPSSSYDNFAPSSMYPKIDYPSYGSTQKQ